MTFDIDALNSAVELAFRFRPCSRTASHAECPDLVKRQLYVVHSGTGTRMTSRRLGVRQKRNSATAPYRDSIGLLFATGVRSSDHRFAVLQPSVAERPVALPPVQEEGGRVMPGDPKECRLRAMRCAELAATAKSQQLKATLLELSKNWVKLAESLERTQALLDDGKVAFKNHA
jgi:hypothetical protein